jgi:hypothetical protein
LRVLEAIEQFGVEAVTGEKTLRPSFIQRARYVRWIINGHKIRKKSTSWVVFAGDNPALADALLDAERLAYGERN